MHCIALLYVHRERRSRKSSGGDGVCTRSAGHCKISRKSALKPCESFFCRTVAQTYQYLRRGKSAVRVF